MITKKNVDKKQTALYFSSVLGYGWLPLLSLSPFFISKKKREKAKIENKTVIPLGKVLLTRAQLAAHFGAACSFWSSL
jgi:hypothetical protein